MRLNRKLVALLLLAGVGFCCLSFWNRCQDVNHEDNNFYRKSEIPLPDSDMYGDSVQNPQANVAWAHLNQLSPQQQSDLTSYQPIDCIINEEYTVGCRREEAEVFLPFTFISKYFEVYGKITEYDGYERFEWKHSYSRVYSPNNKYTPEGIFMSFEHYNVEVRDRVKCISGIEGVPLSTQWGPEGYFYPIQIAQYGLSHFSKHLTDTERDISDLEDAESRDTESWTLLDGDSNVDNIYDPASHSRVIEFTAPESLDHPGVKLQIDVKNRFFLSFDFKFSNNGSWTVAVEPKGKQPERYYLHYVCSRTLILVEDNNIYYGIGERHRWGRITRDISTDFSKGLALLKIKKKTKKSLNKIVSLHMRGHGFVDNITLATSAHLAQFYYAANWLVLHQDAQGGWPNMVTRKLANGALSLPPGWYSAMAQGQAMSLLTRAYLRTRNRKYLDSALKATLVFDVPSADGGVLAHVMDKYDWYEEYPTTPSCFVLNGFIYALIGLYDLKTVAPVNEGEHASRLYDKGMLSLRTLLPLFDTGSGSIYDLRHLTLGVAPNLARWDYHTTHINQLLLLATISDDAIFTSTADRWIGYMKGKRAPHN